MQYLYYKLYNNISWSIRRPVHPGNSSYFYREILSTLTRLKDLLETILEDVDQSNISDRKVSY